MIASFTQTIISEHNGGAPDHKQFLRYIANNDAASVTQVLGSINDINVAKNLLLLHDNVNYDPLHIAALRENAVIAGIILTKLFSLDNAELLKTVLTTVNEDGYSALQYFALDKKLFREAVKQAKDAGKLRDLLLLKDTNNKTILHLYADVYVDYNTLEDIYKVLEDVQKCIILSELLINESDYVDVTFNIDDKKCAKTLLTLIEEKANESIYTIPSSYEHNHTTTESLIDYCVESKLPQLAAALVAGLALGKASPYLLVPLLFIESFSVGLSIPFGYTDHFAYIAQIAFASSLAGTHYGDKEKLPGTFGTAGLGGMAGLAMTGAGTLAGSLTKAAHSYLCDTDYIPCGD